MGRSRRRYGGSWFADSVESGYEVWCKVPGVEWSCMYLLCMGCIFVWSWGYKWGGSVMILALVAYT